MSPYGELLAIVEMPPGVRLDVLHMPSGAPLFLATCSVEFEAAGSILLCTCRRRVPPLDSVIGKRDGRLTELLLAPTLARRAPLPSPENKASLVRRLLERLGGGR